MQSLVRRTQLAGVGGGIWIPTHVQVRWVWYHLVAGGGMGYTLARKGHVQAAATLLHVAHLGGKALQEFCFIGT